MNKLEAKPEMYKTVRRADLLDLDQLLEDICVEWDRLTEAHDDSPHGQLATAEWDGRVLEMQERLEEVRSSLKAMNRNRPHLPRLH